MRWTVFHKLDRIIFYKIGLLKYQFYKYRYRIRFPKTSAAEFPEVIFHIL